MAAPIELRRDERWRFIQLGEDVYRAPLVGVTFPDGTVGNMRWFCPKWQWAERISKRIYPFGVNAK